MTGFDELDETLPRQAVTNGLYRSHRTGGLFVSARLAASRTHNLRIDSVFGVEVNRTLRFRGVKLHSPVSHVACPFITRVGEV